MNHRTRTCMLQALRPLARSLLIVLTALPMSAAMAGDLDNQTAVVTRFDPAETWSLINGSRLTVNNAQTHQITAGDTSTIVMNGGSVTLDPNVTAGHNAVVLTGSASLQAAATRFLGGGIALSGTRSTAHLVGSSIIVDTARMHPDARKSVGVDLVMPATITGPYSPIATLDSTFIGVDDIAGSPDSASGIGVRMQFGQADIINGSNIDAANIGVLLWGERDAIAPIRLRIDDSAIQTGRGAAIQVMPLFDNTYDITVANGSQLFAGDGNLLLVKNINFASNARTDVNFTVDNAQQQGNVTFDPTTVTNGSLSVLLQNRSQLFGQFIDVTRAVVGTDSTWVMTGDSNVGRLQLDATGTVALGNGSSFNTLSVDEFVGNGGTLAFNTQLGDDTSATDKLVIAGDANGQANVRVFNAGGAGAKTNRGIELIDIGGASNAQFDLIGRAVGGQYEYFLVKDANGNWYLRSELATAPDPCVIDPTLPECGTIDPPVDPPIDPPLPILRPETGAYLANQFALNQLLRHQWRDRQGGDTAAADGMRGWARVDSTQSKLGAVDDQLDLRVQRSRLQLGADVGVFDEGRGRVGLMATAAQSQAQSRSVITGYSARGKLEGGAIGAYGNWNNDALYVDASVQRGQFRNRVQGEGLGEERYDSDIWQSSLEAGYRIALGQVGNTALSLQPELQLVYTDASTDVHTESNGTIVRSLGDDGLSGRVGLRLQGESRATSGASVSPYLAVNWYRDAASNGMSFDDETLRADVPRNRYEVNAGGRVEFRSGLSGWGGLGVMRGDHGYREATANLGMSYRW